jgi:hypothetical protein
VRTKRPAVAPFGATRSIYTKSSGVSMISRPPSASET